MSNDELNKGGVQGRSGLYAYVSKYTKEAIDVLVILMRTSRNEGIKMGAARALLDKSLPDLKADDASLESTEPLRIVFTSKPIPDHNLKP